MKGSCTIIKQFFKHRSLKINTDTLQTARKETESLRSDKIALGKKEMNDRFGKKEKENLKKKKEKKKR